MKLLCRPDEVVAVINELRDVAEIVRSYGDLGQTGRQRPSLGAMPMQLYLLAAAAEAEMRSIVHTDQLCASRAWGPADHPPRSVMRFDLAAADTVVVGAVSTENCVAELNEAQRRLTAAITRLRDALQSSATEQVCEGLDKEAERLRVFVAAFA